VSDYIWEKKGKIYKHMRQKGNLQRGLQAGRGARAWLGEAQGLLVPLLVNQLVYFAIFTLKIRCPLPKNGFLKHKCKMWAVTPSCHRAQLVIQHRELWRVESYWRCFLI